MPKISIIVPVYKVEKYLDRCVKSILRQDFTDWELILVDDGSPDKCPALCDDFAAQYDRIKVLHKENGGLSSARNAGIDAASGEYIYFLDSDDWISDSALGKLLALASKNNADIVSSSYALVKSDDDIPAEKTGTVRVFDRDSALEFYMYTGMKNRICDYPAWGKLYKKDLFFDITFPVGQLYEDVVTVFKLIKKSCVYVKIDEPLYYYFQCGSSIVRSSFKMRDMDAVLVGKQLIDETAGEKECLRKYAYQKEARGYFSVLCKMGFYGIDSSVQFPEHVISETEKEFKKRFSMLITSPMPLSRKIIAVMLRINCRGALKLLGIISGRSVK